MKKYLFVCDCINNFGLFQWIEETLNNGQTFIVNHALTNVYIIKSFEDSNVLFEIINNKIKEFGSNYQFILTELAEPGNGMEAYLNTSSLNFMCTD